MNWEEAISVISAITVALAAVVAAHAAKRGLDTWRLQMRGKNEYKIARDLLVSLYKYRDAICEVRQPWSNYPELRKDPNKVMGVNDIGKRKEFFVRFHKEYQRKWGNVIKRKQHIYKDMVIAEALWGDELYSLFNQLFEREHTLLRAIKWNIKLIDPDTPVGQRPNATQEKIKDMVDIAISVKSGDTFGKKIMEDIKSIEQYLKKKLETTLAS